MGDTMSSNAIEIKYFQDTIIIFSVYDLLHNVDHWKDPGEFRPERFLTKDGNLMQDEWFMPFGAGKIKFMINSSH